MHYPGHLREAFCDWLDEGCPPLASVEVRYRPTTWPAEQLLRKMLHCSDVVPGEFYREVCESLGIEPKRQTYGAIARELLSHRLITVSRMRSE
jgi:hypothetical protein